MSTTTIFVAAQTILNVSGIWLVGGIPNVAETIAISFDDGITWSPIAGTDTVLYGGVRSLIWNGVSVVAIGSAGTEAVAYCSNYSSASPSFTAGAVANPLPVVIRAGCFAKNKFLYMNNNGYVNVSQDGTNFTAYYFNTEKISQEPKYNCMETAIMGRHSNKELGRKLYKGDIITVYGKRHGTALQKAGVNITFNLP
jgi:hypothetical protein